MGKKGYSTRYYIWLNIIQFALEFGMMTTAGNTLFHMYDMLSDIHENHSIVYIGHLLVASIFQFICGVLSDNCKSKEGRRRPFMKLGCFIFIVGQFISFFIILSTGIKRSLENNEKYVKGNDIPMIQKVSFAIYVVGSYIAVIGIGIMRIAYRSYILDEFDSELQNKIFTMASIVTGCSRIFCYLLIGLVSIIDRKSVV